MKLFLFKLLLLLTLSGCSYEAPLEKDNKIKIDPALLGRWELIDSNSSTIVQLLILKFSDSEYLINYREDQSGYYFRGYLIKIGNITCIQLQVLGNDSGPHKKDEKRLYLVATYQIKDKNLVVRLLNENLISNKLNETKTLKKEFLKNMKHEELFEEPGTFKPITEKI